MLLVQISALFFAIGAWPASRSPDLGTYCWIGSIICGFSLLELEAGRTCPATVFPPSWPAACAVPVLFLRVSRGRSRILVAVLD